MRKQAHLIQILIVDHDQVGIKDVATILENTRFPNDCMSLSVMSVDSADIGEWDDSHPLNHSGKQAAEVDRLFGTNFLDT